MLEQATAAIRDRSSIRGTPTNPRIRRSSARLLRRARAHLSPGFCPLLIAVGHGSEEGRDTTRARLTGAPRVPL